MKGGLIVKENTKVSILLAIVAIVAIIAIMICCLASLGYNSKVSIEKEKIEVSSTSNITNSNQ